MDKTYAKKLAASAMMGLSALVVTLDAQAQQPACTGSTGGVVQINGGKAGTTASTTGFFQQGFDLQCSASVLSAYNEVTAGVLAVGAVSEKGNMSFIGSSNGGGVKDSGKCATTNCANSDLTTAMGLASTL